MTEQTDTGMQLPPAKHDNDNNNLHHTCKACKGLVTADKATALAKLW